MADRYRLDADAMTSVAGGLDEAADQVHAASEVLDGDSSGLGPGGIDEAVGELTVAWQGRLHAVYDDVASASTDVRAARDAYLDADAEAAGVIERGAGGVIDGR